MGVWDRAASKIWDPNLFLQPLS